MKEIVSNNPRERQKYWYGLKKDGSQVRATEEQMTNYISDSEPMKLDVLWSDTAILQDGTRLAKTKKAAESRGWADIAIAPFNFI